MTSRPASRRRVGSLQVFQVPVAAVMRCSLSPTALGRHAPVRAKRVPACEPTQQERYDFGCRAGCRSCEGEASPFPRSGPADGLFPCWIGHSQRASRSRVVAQSAMKVQWRSSSEPHDLFGIGTPPNSTAPSCKACAAPMLRARRGAIGVDHISLCRKAKRPPCVQGGHGGSCLSRSGPLGARLCRGGVATGPRWALGCVAGLCPWPRGPQSTRRLTPRMTPDNSAAVKIACGKRC